MHRDERGVTLVAIVITVIVLLILSGVVINVALVENGLLSRTKQAEVEHTKEEATEKINLKITNIQISTYTKEQRLPSLQELANGLCLDNEIEYVLLESKSTAVLEPIIVGENQSIFTKIKEYPYEFEINAKLQLASIDGVRMENNNVGGREYVSTELKEILDSTNEIVEINDVITPSFYEKVANDKESAKKILQEIIQQADAEEVLLRIGANMIPVLSNNSNVLVSSQYSSSFLCILCV